MNSVLVMKEYAEERIPKKARKIIVNCNSKCSAKGNVSVFTKEEVQNIYALETRRSGCDEFSELWDE
ncbi:hypothetical protein [Anaerosolibacter sp.]|uniref:hypothetical protein n=1 Tax=Anaerosolibacter sp. TaxID=1872527 RepID=UPI00262066D8|nr:hypothetical protein [Anaerosolibacter sp.]